MNRLDGKVALITGAARGIGGRTAQLMAEAGASVLIGDILDEAGRETAGHIVRSGGVANYLTLDVTSERSWAAAVADAIQRHGKLDILVNNAGIFTGKDFEEATLADWHKLVAVNMTGVFLGTKIATPALPCALQVRGSMIPIRAAAPRRNGIPTATSTAPVAATFERGRAGTVAGIGGGVARGVAATFSTSVRMSVAL